MAASWCACRGLLTGVLRRRGCRFGATPYSLSPGNDALAIPILVRVPETKSYATIAGLTPAVNKFPSLRSARCGIPAATVRFSSTNGDRAHRKYIRLTDFNEIVFPSPMKVIRNAIFSFLIRGYFDPHFHKAAFLEGACQAISTVSNIISAGRFEELRGLVTSEAIAEVQTNVARMTDSDRKFLAIMPGDIALRFLYEIGIMYNDSTGQRFVEVTVVAQGVHGYTEFARQLQTDSPSKLLQSKQDSIFTCNYRFIRDYTKGVEDSWTINKLNHFCPGRM